MSNAVKLICLERCSIMGSVYLPGEIELDAERAEFLLKIRPQTFKKAGGGLSGGSDADGLLGDTPEEAPAPERRRTKPARVKRKERR